MEKSKIWIPGQPARVTHQSGTRFHGRYGTYKLKSLRDWEAKLKESLDPYKPEQPLEVPVRLQVVFGFCPPAKRQNGRWKLTRPDTDNSVKTLKDVMSDLGFWKDDSQVVYESYQKVWTNHPGIYIQIDALPEQVEGWLLPGFEEIQRNSNDYIQQ